MTADLQALREAAKATQAEADACLDSIVDAHRKLRERCAVESGKLSSRSLRIVEDPGPVRARAGK